MRREWGWYRCQSQQRFCNDNQGAKIAEPGVSNVILTVWQDPSIQGVQCAGILHFGELHDSAEALGYVWKRSRWTNNLQCQGRLKPRIQSHSLDLTHLTSVWNSVRAGIDILLTRWHQILLHVNLWSMTSVLFLHCSLLLSCGYGVLRAPYTWICLFQA